MNGKIERTLLQIRRDLREYVPETMFLFPKEYLKRLQKLTRERIEDLEEEVSSIEEINYGSKIYAGYISKSTKICFSKNEPCMLLDDMDIYTTLLKRLVSVEYTKDWDNIFTILQIIDDTIIDVYGINCYPELRERFFSQYSDSDIVTISKMKGHNILDNAHKSVLIQNLLAFLGYDIEMSITYYHHTIKIIQFIMLPLELCIYDCSRYYMIKNAQGNLRKVPCLAPISIEEYKNYYKGDFCNPQYQGIRDIVRGAAS